MIDNYHIKIPWAGLIVIFELHFVWSSVSGMETLLHAVIILSVALLLIRRSPPWFVLGLLTGLSTWVRPDGMTLVGPILLTAFIVEQNWKKRAHAILRILIGFGLLFAPYLLFNFSLTGKVLPTTFYAKQAEYAGWQAEPILSRLASVTLSFLAGAAIILLPGFIIQVKDALKGKQWGQIAMFIWMIG